MALSRSGDDTAHTLNEALKKAAAIGGQLDDAATTAATEDNVAPARITPQRALHMNLRNASGTEVGTAAVPVRVDPTGTTTQPVSGTVGVSGVVDTELPAAAALADAAVNPITPVVGADLQIFNGTTWDRARGDIANGLDVDVTRSVLPTGAATLAEQQTQTTALQLIDDAVHAANAALGKALAIGGVMDDTATVVATEGNVSAARINAQRALHGTLRNDDGSALAVLDGQPTAIGAILAAAINTANGAAMLLRATSNRLLVDGSGVTQPVSVAGTVTVDTEIAAAVAAADGVANPTAGIVQSFPSLHSGASWDRQVSALGAQDSTGAGVAAAGIFGQFDDVATAAVTENRYAPVRISTRRALLIEGVASGTAVAVSAASLPLPAGAATSALQTQPGVDIGDVTVNNAAGGSAVNIQDGGNSITVDGTVALSGTSAVNIAQHNGVTPLMGDGVTGTGSPRVTIAAPAHDAADTGGPVKVGHKAINHGAAPTPVANNDRTDWYANRHGVPWVMGGHPNVVTLRANYTAANTNTVIVAGVANTKIVVTRCSVLVGNTSVTVQARVGFAASVTPTTTGVVASHPNMSGTSGIVEGNGGGILGVSANGDALLITSTVPTGGSIDVVVSYYVIAEV
jgi:hypothetical protein